MKTKNGKSHFVKQWRVIFCHLQATGKGCWGREIIISLAVVWGTTTSAWKFLNDWQQFWFLYFTWNDTQIFLCKMLGYWASATETDLGNILSIPWQLPLWVRWVSMARARPGARMGQRANKCTVRSSPLWLLLFHSSQFSPSDSVGSYFKVHL